MKDTFSVTVYHNQHLTFYIVNCGKKIIHLTASFSKHENAVHILKTKFQCSEVKNHTCNNFISDLINTIINEPKKKPPEPDFKSNPFLGSATEFQKKVWRLMTMIAYGEIITYKVLASKAGVPRGARAIGNVCNTNPLALIIPCHRVVSVNGMGGYAGGVEIKAKLLDIEKLMVSGETID